MSLAERRSVRPSLAKRDLSSGVKASVLGWKWSVSCDTDSPVCEGVRDHVWRVSCWGIWMDWKMLRGEWDTGIPIRLHDGCGDAGKRPSRTITACQHTYIHTIHSMSVNTWPITHSCTGFTHSTHCTWVNNDEQMWANPAVTTCRLISSHPPFSLSPSASGSRSSFCNIGIWKILKILKFSRQGGNKEKQGGWWKLEQEPESGGKMPPQRVKIS